MSEENKNQNFEEENYPRSIEDSLADNATEIVGEITDVKAKAVKEVLVIDTLKTIYDPEIPVNIYDLGLIYDVKCLKGASVEILLTLTTPNCPVAAILPRQIAETVHALQEVDHVKLTLTWQPPWDYSRMSEDARMILGF